MMTYSKHWKLKLIAVIIGIATTTSSLAMVPPVQPVNTMAAWVAVEMGKYFTDTNNLEVYLLNEDHPTFRNSELMQGWYMNNRKDKHWIGLKKNEDQGELAAHLIHELAHYLQDLDLDCAALVDRSKVEREAYEIENRFRKKHNLYTFTENQIDTVVKMSTESYQEGCRKNDR